MKYSLKNSATSSSFDRILPFSISVIFSFVGFVLEKRGFTVFQNCSLFSIQRGVRQGCILSPKLFNLYTEDIFKEADKLPGVNLGGINITNLRYADDTALTAESAQGLQLIVDVVKSESLKRGLKMNVKKTKTMVVSRDQVNPKVDIKVDGTTLEQVETFKYLGQTITSDGRSDTAIRQRIEIARQTFLNMSDVLTS